MKPFSSKLWMPRLSTETDEVLEIGAGMGALTRHLAANAGKVTAVEIDNQLFPILKEGDKGIPQCPPDPGRYHGN